MATIDRLAKKVLSDTVAVLVILWSLKRRMFGG